MAQLKDQQAGTSGDPFTVGGNLTVTGTTTFTGGLASALSIANGGTGSTTASGARTNLSAAASGANSDITSLAGITAGTATAPAFTTSGDINTGMFFPAADTIAFSEGGVETMRLDSSGNVGIGTTSPTPTFGTNVLQIYGSAATEMRFTSGTTGTSSTDGLSVGIDSSSVGYLYNRENQPIVFGTNNTERMRITSDGLLQFNSGYGSAATAYGCRAWVNFNGTGTVAINGSGNVSSITDNGTGDYTVNFTTAMPDTNYASVGSCIVSLAQSFLVGFIANTVSTGSFRFNCEQEGSNRADTVLNAVSFFR
jgi:hypothetical protein